MIAALPKLGHKKAKFPRKSVTFLFFNRPKLKIFIGWANEINLTIFWLHKKGCICNRIPEISNFQVSLYVHLSQEPLVVEFCLFYAKLTFLNQAKFSIFDFSSMPTCSDSTAIFRIFVWNDFSGGFFSMKKGSYRKTNSTFTVTTFWGYEIKVGLFFRFEAIWGRKRPLKSCNFDRAAISENKS